MLVGISSGGVFRQVGPMAGGPGPLYSERAGFE